MGPLVCLVILQLNAAAAKGRQQVNIQLAKELQQFNICQAQQEVKNFTNFPFNMLNGPGQKPGMLSDVMHLFPRRFCAGLSRR